MVALTRAALSKALTPDYLKLTFYTGDSVLHTPAVGFKLGFTFTTTHADTAFLEGQVAPKACQPREQVLQLREFDLELALARASALGENVKDERGAIEDFAIKYTLQIAALRGRKFVIKDDRIDLVVSALAGKLIRFPASDKCPGRRRVKLLGSVADDFSARCGSELVQFFQGILDFTGLLCF